MGRLVYFWEAQVVNYIIHILFGHYIFGKVGTANSRLGTGLPGPIRGAVPEGGPEKAWDGFGSQNNSQSLELPAEEVISIKYQLKTFFNF